MAKDIHDMSDEIAQSMREIFEATENDMMHKVNTALVKHSNSKNYKQKQVASKSLLKKQLMKDAKKSISLLTASSKVASQIANINPDKMVQQVERNTALLVGSAMWHHNNSISKIIKLEKHSELKKSIFKQTQRGIDEGLKIKTKRGNMGYKEYMEMSVRTTVQTEISEQQLKYGANGKVVFYIVNEFQDCADDHKDYQGKIYFDERYASMGFNDDIVKAIKKKISSKKMLSVQNVRTGIPYLTTRPNCRHTFKPLSIDQALNLSPKKILKDNKWTTGSYKKDNYADTQQQRANERNIRRYRARSDMNSKLYKETNDKAYLLQSQKDKALMTKWRKQQIKLLKSNKTLSRDYRRETRKVLVNDLGAKYNTPKKPMIKEQVLPPVENKDLK